VSTWKVILAILVIFTAGLFTGGAVLRKFGPHPVSRPWERPGGGPFLPREATEDYVRRLVRDLNLTPAQKEQVSKIVTDSQQRIKSLYEKIGPEMREEMRQVRESVRAVLTPDQQRVFDEMRKRRGSHPSGGLPEGGRPRHRGTPPPSETNPPSAPEPPSPAALPPAHKTPSPSPDG
jgi:hypothetical protein